MTFRRTRLLIKISIVAMIVEIILGVLSTILLGIIFAIQFQAFWVFLVFLAGGIVSGFIFWLLYKFIKWLLEDYNELDGQIRTLNIAIANLKKQVNNGSSTVEVVKEEPAQVEENKQEEAAKSDNALSKGDKVVLTKDFNDYGLNFEKGMVGVLESDPDNNTVRVRMSDKIKGSFRLSLDQIEKVQK